MIKLMLAASLCAAPASAEGDWPCKDDAATLCKDVKPGEGRIIKCLKQREAELSGSCRASMTKKKEEFGRKHPQAAKTMAACEADKEKFCQDVKPGEGRIVDCMKSHAGELSPGCREMMEHKAKGGDHKEKGKK
jgi:hypothetical protein